MILFALLIRGRFIPTAIIFQPKSASGLLSDSLIKQICARRVHRLSRHFTILVSFQNKNLAQSAVNLLHITADYARRKNNFFFKICTNSRHIFGKRQFRAKFCAKIISRTPRSSLTSLLFSCRSSFYFILIFKEAQKKFGKKIQKLKKSKYIIDNHYGNQGCNASARQPGGRNSLYGTKL